jgi:diguanylate cyclase (GGDEF)-like protein
VTAVVPKPVDADELAGWLNALAGRGGAEPYSILIVDHELLRAQTYALRLQRAGMHAHVFSEPARVFEALFAGNYDLVMVHLQMPGVDGIDLARVIRQTRRFLFLPIVFVSAEEDKDQQLLARQVGGDDFISKPVDLDRLVRLVRVRAERARALRTAMERDGLTGLLTHGRFKERLHSELDRCRRNGNRVCLAMMDLDHFKTVNDGYGHLVGDRVLRALAHCLTNNLRDSDVLGRYGGEEFAAILMDTEPAQAVERIDALRQRFGALPFGTELGTFTVTLSVGVAGSADYPDMDTLIEAADQALYLAKRDGRNGVRTAAQPLLLLPA